MRVVTFGEVMLRLCPPGFLRLEQTLPGRLDATFGGGEVNVAVSIARQGGNAAFLTVLPDNPLTDAFTAELRRFGVGTDLVRRSRSGRFGVYFVETGANQRAGTVTYDRDGSALAGAGPHDFDWDAAFRGADWFHITGITPALSASAAASAEAAVAQAKQRGLTVSCDLNFRKKLWRWQPGRTPSQLAQEVLARMLPHVDLVIANEEDCDHCLGIRAEGTAVESGRIDADAYLQVAREVVRRFPNVARVAVTLRVSHSASHNSWGAMLYESAADRCWFSPLDGAQRYAPFEIAPIVDRVGAGDAFAGGLIFALREPALSSPQAALNYAVAASCLKHSMVGDFNYATRAEIEALAAGQSSGRVQR
jgi:2-dehydro-3-deoxygluconokinase